MDLMKFCADRRRRHVFSSAATKIATPQIKSPPAFKIGPPKKKPVRKAQPQPVPPPAPSPRRP